MDRAEQAGLGVAIAGHVALFAALSLGLLSAPDLPKLDSQPVEVTLATEVDLRSAAPTQAPPAPTLPQSEPAPLEPAPAPILAAPPPPPLIEKPQPKPEPKPAAKLEPAPKPKQKAETKPKPVTKPIKVAKADPEARRRPGLSNSIVSGLSDTPTPTKPAKPSKVSAPAVANPSPAAPALSAAEAGAVKRALGQEIGRQLKPRWKSPSGADIDQLVTILSWDLAKDGSLIGEPRFVDQTGVTPSNGPQARLHRDNAIKAVRAATPFRLPAEHYAYWKSIISFRFDKRLSQ